MSTEIFNSENDLNVPAMTVRIYPVTDGFLPDWKFENVPKGPYEISQLHALLDGLDAAKKQIENLIDLLVGNLYE